jgi:biopolymer transport protein ExbB/TolQ
MLDFFVHSWELWRSMDWFGRGDVTLLAVMLVDTMATMCFWFYRHSAARRQTRAFVHDATAGLHDGKFDEVLAIAEQNGRSPVATVVAAGLTAFVSAPPQSTHAKASESAERATQRSRKMRGAELKMGLRTFTTIASTAIFTGLLGTCFGILYAFRGAGMEKHALIARVNSDIADALVPTTMGRFVSVLAMWCPGSSLRALSGQISPRGHRPDAQGVRAAVCPESFAQITTVCLLRLMRPRQM